MTCKFTFQSWHGFVLSRHKWKFLTWFQMHIFILFHEVRKITSKMTFVHFRFIVLSCIIHLDLPASLSVIYKKAINTSTRFWILLITTFTWKIGLIQKLRPIHLRLIWCRGFIVPATMIFKRRLILVFTRLVRVDIHNIWRIWISWY